MDLNRLTEKAQEALRAAQSEATRLGHPQIDVEHLLLALLDQEGGLAKSILDKTAVDAELVRSRVEAELARLPKVSSTTGGAGDVYVTGFGQQIGVRAGSTRCLVALGIRVVDPADARLAEVVPPGPSEVADHMG